MLTPFHRNLTTCHHCDQGPVTCAASGRPARDHATAGDCPLKLFDQPGGPLPRPDPARAFRALLAEAVALLPATPPGEGTGIVTAAGGEYFDCAYAQWRLLRGPLGYAGPIECFHFAGEIAAWMREAAAPLGVRFIDADAMATTTAPALIGGPGRGYKLKPFAIINCSFANALFIDADAYPVRPDFLELFGSPQFAECGAIYFPDSANQDLKPHQWAAFGLLPRQEPAFESGVIYVDKQRHGAALQLALWLCEHGDYTFKVLLGDKDTFHFACHVLGTPYAQIPHRWVRPDGTERPADGPDGTTAAMVQRDFDGRPLFVHRTRSKLSLEDSVGFGHFATTEQLQDKRDDRLPHEAEVWSYLEDLRPARARYPVLHRLESAGDVLTLLPALKHLSRSHARVTLVTHADYAPIASGLPWLDVVTFRGSARDVAAAKRSVRHLGEMRDVQPPDPNDLPNWTLECWSRTGLPIDLFHELPLEIDNRDAAAERAVVERYAGRHRPLLLLNTLGRSSPYPHGDILRAMLRRRYARHAQVLDLSLVDAPRVIDLLGLYERACGLISVDTGTLHLSYATRTPTVALVNDDDAPGPKPGWRASQRRPHWVGRMTYSESATAAGLERIAAAVDALIDVPMLVGRDGTLHRSNT